MELEARQQASDDLKAFTRIALAFGGEKKDREAYIKPLLEAIGQEQAGAGNEDDLAKAIGRGF